MSTYGTMTGIDQAIEYLADCKPRSKEDDMPLRIIERLRYIRDKDIGVKPKFHKGQYGHKFDYWTCGNCGAATKDGVGDTYCRNCGFRILWDSPRCLTGVRDPVKDPDKQSRSHLQVRFFGGRQ